MGGYTDWADEGDEIRTEENTPPGADTSTVRYLPLGATEVEVISPGQHYSHAHNEGDDPLGNDEVPPTPMVNAGVWQANTDQEPPGHYGHMYEPDGSAYVDGESGLHYASHGSSGRRDWFYYAAPVTDVDYLWQKQVRTETPGTDPVMEYEYSKVIEGDECDEEEDGKKIVVCKYVGTPPGVLDHIVIVSENSLNNVVDANGRSFAGVFPFSWTDAHGGTQVGSTAIRYATDNEQAKDVPLSACFAEIPLPDPGYTDPCGADNSVWTPQTDGNGLDWTLDGRSLSVVITAADTTFPGGATSHDYGTPPDSNEPCPPNTTVIPLPQPGSSDPCGPNNSAWDPQTDGNGLDWTLDGRSLSVAITAANTTFPGGATTHNYGTPPDSNTPCPPNEIALPAAAGISDPCDPGNAEWIVPGDDETFQWDLVDGELIVTILADDTVFEGTGETTHNFGEAVEVNVEPCEVGGVQLEIPAEPGVKDPCDADNATWIVPDDNNTLVWTLTNGVLSVEIIAPDTVFEGTQDTTFSFGEAEETNTEPCVKGEQGNNPPLVEVKGVQGVPSAVDAGLGTTSSPMPAGRNPLWLLVIGGGLGLMGSAGLRRRTAANR